VKKRSPGEKGPTDELDAVSKRSAQLRSPLHGPGPRNVPAFSTLDGSRGPGNAAWFSYDGLCSPGKLLCTAGDLFLGKVRSAKRALVLIGVIGGERERRIMSTRLIGYIYIAHRCSCQGAISGHSKYGVE
jgi:hypothetical protein